MLYIAPLLLPRPHNIRSVTATTKKQRRIIVPTWLQIISKVNPLTHAVDAIRQIFLAGNSAALRSGIESGNSVIGITIFGHTMTILEDVVVISALGVLLIL